MKTILLPALIIGTLLASCAPITSGRADLLQAGQVWTIDVGGAVSTLIVSDRRQPGGASTGYGGVPRVDQGASVIDTFTEGAPGRRPAIIAASQLRLTGPHLRGVSCAVRHAVGTIGVAQDGFGRAASSSSANDNKDVVSSLSAGVDAYLDTGDRSAGLPCTLTRVK
ncbi:hypothetical protein [uncultured Deinococcus sp.]|uniref:hypothetical protein n=1 Tax=uncultured Deinococcus sp. TaxID=158789 RepID=UPI0025D3C846|nr:hypothetical protein [uncultured Deinococcus sp.]